MSKYGQNIKYDVIVLQRQGVALRGVVCDTMIAGYLLNPSRARPQHGRTVARVPAIRAYPL